MAAGQERRADEQTAILIDRRFRIFPDRALPSIGGHNCLAAADAHEPARHIAAVRASPMLRAELPAFLPLRHPGMLSPIAHGVVASGGWLISEAPAGPPLATALPQMGGNALLTQVLRPVALALEHLHSHGLTHRAIRPDNVFIGNDRRSAVLGPACAAPPGYRQPPVFETAYGALCSPAARGRGTILDDVYALGILLLWLWARALPHSELTAAEIARLKLDQGSYGLLAGGLRLPSSLDEMIRAMLADDPQARPWPSDLVHLDTSHSRRGSRRSSLRAVQPLVVGPSQAWNRPTLALLCAEQPAEAMLLLRTGTLEQWLRRTADDPGLVVEAEALRRDDIQLEARIARFGTSEDQIEQNLRLTRLINLLDPLAPLFWQGTWLAPDALGTLLAEAARQPPGLDPTQAARLVRALLVKGALDAWLLSRGARPAAEPRRLPQRLVRLAEASDQRLSLLRVIHALNPFLPCQTPLLSHEPVTTLREAALALERLAGQGAAFALDTPLRAFLEARLDEQATDLETGAPGSAPSQSLQDLVLLSSCQMTARLGPLPQLAASLLPALERTLDDWPGVSRRGMRLATLRRLAEAGDLRDILDLLTSPSARLEDDAARKQARHQAAQLEAALADHPTVKQQLLARNMLAAREFGCAVGVLAVMASLLLDLLG